MIAVLLLLLMLAQGSARGEDSPEDRALSYLSAEVPRWSRENHCYSCHNNGDAARALYEAFRLGRSITAQSTGDTDRWLERPEAWDKNGGDGPFSDKTLARVQFTAALAAAIAAGRVQGRDSMARAASRLAIDQDVDGSWKLDEQGQAGSPTTYGRPLATWTAREALRLADENLYRHQIDRADTWLRQLVIANVLDASTILLAQGYDQSPPGLDRRRRALDQVRLGQSSDGGWGPFVKSAPEAFDTALALLSLDRHRDQPGVLDMIRRGRAYLVETQQPDGSWVETTRPSGAESYAQRLSTTGWATLALLTVKAP